MEHYLVHYEQQEVLVTQGVQLVPKHGQVQKEVCVNQAHGLEDAADYVL